MNEYTIRVELHSDQYTPDFKALHDAMGKEGFSKLITSDDGKTYYLPRAEYNISTMKSISQVLEATEKAVGVTGKSAEILVTKSAGRQWIGLTPKE